MLTNKIRERNPDVSGVCQTVPTVDYHLVMTEEFIKVYR
jgi:hypothetical protein